MVGETRDEAAIAELLSRAADAEDAGDAEVFVQLLTPEAIMLPPGLPPAIGADAIRHFWQGLFEQFSLRNTAVNAEEILVTGDWAYLRVTYEVVITNMADGSSQTEKGKSLWIVKRQMDGTWKFTHVIWNADA